MKVSKKILSAILSTAMLAGTVAPISVFADSKVEETTTTIVDENFENVNLEAEKSTKLKAIDGTNFSYRTNPYEAGVATVEVSDEGISEKSLKINYGTGGGESAFVQVQPSEAVYLKTGDIVHVNFDTKYSFDSSGAYEASLIHLMLGDNQNALDAADSAKVEQYFEPIDDATYNAGVTSKNESGYKGTILTLNGVCVRPGNQLTENKYHGAPNYYTRNRVNIDIVINTADESQGGKQTIKQTYSYYKTDGSVGTTEVHYAIFDAKYDGNGDTNIDKITEFTGLKFFTRWMNNNSAFFVDNMKIEKVERNTLYYTTTTKNLIDCDFSDVTSFSSSNAAKTYTPVTGESNAYFGTTYGAVQNGSVENILGPNGTYVNAFKQSINAVAENAEYPAAEKAGFCVLTLKNSNGTTKINNGDIIRFSYDMKHDMATELTGTSYFFGPMLNSPRYDDEIGNAEKYGITESKNNIYLNTYSATSAVEQHSKYRNGFLLEQQTMLWPAGTPIQTVTRSRVGKTNPAVEQDKWHHYEFIINTADKAQDGKQSVKVYIDRGTADELVLYSDCDMNILDSSVDKFTEFRTLEMALFKVGLTTATGTIYSTNYKLDVITPGFGVSGSAIENNDPTDGITLDPGTMTVECTLNVPGTDKKSTDADYPTYTYTMYAAQYDGDTLVSVKPVKGNFTEYDNKASFTVDVADGVDTLKLFAFDDDLTPLVVNVTAGVDSATAARSISYTLANSDIH